MTPERLLNMSIKLYTSPKNFIPPKQISDYAPAYLPVMFQDSPFYCFLSLAMYTACAMTTVILAYFSLLLSFILLTYLSNTYNVSRAESKTSLGGLR